MTKILLVEDEVALSEPLAFLLDKEGYEIIVAEDGTAALELFASHSPDLILLDLMLPGIPGSMRSSRTRSGECEEKSSRAAVPSSATMIS